MLPHAAAAQDPFTIRIEGKEYPSGGPGSHEPGTGRCEQNGWIHQWDQQQIKVHVPNTKMHAAMLLEKNACKQTSKCCCLERLEGSCTHACMSFAAEQPQ